MDKKLTLQERMALGQAAIDGEKEYKDILLKKACAREFGEDIAEYFAGCYDTGPLIEAHGLVVPILRAPDCYDIMVDHFHINDAKDDYILCEALDVFGFIVASPRVSRVEDLNVALAKAKKNGKADSSDLFSKLFDALGNSRH